MAVVRNGVLCSLYVCALACGFDTGGLGSGSGDLEQTTGPTGGPDANPVTNDTAESVEGDSNPETNDDDGSSGAVDPTGLTTNEDSTGGSGCDGWWDEAWTRRRPVIIDSGELESPLPDVPVLVALDDTRIDYSVVQATGTDLRFVLDTGQVLAHDIERWDPAGLSFVWLRTEIAAGHEDQPRIFMYYGNQAAPAGQAGTNVWDPGFVSVHHLDELADSTANAHDGMSTMPPAAVEGWIGGARGFDGDDDYIRLGDESAYDFTDALTVEAWVRADGFEKYYEALVTKGDDAWRMHRENMTPTVGFGTDSEYTNDNLAGVAIVDDNEWHYLVVVYDGNAKRIFVDGVLDNVDDNPAGPLKTTNDDVMFGDNVTQFDRQFEGDMDEVRISSVQRTRAWIALQYRSMSYDLLDYGAEQSCP